MPSSPVYGFLYDTLADDPNGPDLGRNLALAIDAALAGVDARLVAAEAGVADLVAWKPKRVLKLTLTPRNSTITPTADPHLLVALPINTSWDIYLKLFLSSNTNAAGDFRGRFAYPAGATVSHGGLGLVTAIASGGAGDLIATPTTRLDATSPSVEYQTGCSTSGMIAIIIGSIDMAGTAGNLTLEWAQRVSNANSTNVLEGSELICYRTA